MQWISLGYHSFKRWPIDTYSISCTSIVYSADEQQIYIFYCQSQGNANHSEPKSRKSSVNSFRHSLRRGNLFLRRMTLEAVPRIDNYRDIFTSRSPFRPSLDELHDSNPVDKVTSHWLNCFFQWRDTNERSVASRGCDHTRRAMEGKIRNVRRSPGPQLSEHLGRHVVLAHLLGRGGSRNL